MKLENSFYIKGSDKSVEFGLLVGAVALHEFDVNKYKSLFLSRNNIIYEFKINNIEWHRRKVDYIPEGHSCDIYLIDIIEDIIPMRGEYLQILVPLA